jgi:hypothetical protein
MIRTTLNRLCRTCALLAAVAVSSLALGQGDLYANVSFSLTQPEIAKELGVSEAQTGQIERILRDYSDEQQKLSKKGSTEQAFDKLDDEYSKKIVSVLSATQQNRLRQIALQGEGPSAIARADVAQDLGVGSDVRGKIAAIAASSKAKQEDLDTKVGEKLASIPAPTTKTKAALMAYENKKNAAYASFKDDQKRVDELKAQNDAKILGMLTPAQKAKWQQMLGKKFSA